MHHRGCAHSRESTPRYTCVCVCVCMYKYVYLTSAEPQNSSRSRSTLAPTSCNDVYLMSEFHIGLLPQVLYAAMSGARGECGRELMGEREKER